jgi:hypothetical protein
MTARDPRGFALLSVLLWLSLLGVAALGAALATAAEPPATGALHDHVRLTRAAESAASLAVSALAARVDWTDVPGLGLATPFVDGPPGPRSIGGATVDLVAETRWRTCGRTTPCDDLATDLTSPQRPWGVRNPRWQLVVHQPLAAVDAALGAGCPCYVMAWVADDPADADGDPQRDAPAGVEGHGVLLVRGAAVAARGALAEVEGIVAQPCRRSNAPCAGSRVQSWALVTDGPP